MKSILFTILGLFLVNVEAQSLNLAIGDSLYATGNYAQAINEYAKDGSQKGNLQIARAYNAIGNYEKAVTQYRDLIIRDNTLHIAKFELGILNQKMKQPLDAKNIFEELIAYDPFNPEYFYYLGSLYQDLGDTEKSVEVYKKAIELDSTHLRSIFQVGKYYVAQREKNSALKYLDVGLQFYENDVALINLKALAYFNNDEYKKAKPLFERLLELGERKGHIYSKLAYCYYKNWELEKAKEMYRILLDYDNAKAEAFNGLGDTYWRNKQPDSAAIFFKKAIKEKKPYLGKEYHALAGLAREQNDLKTALEYYKMAYGEDPTNPFNYYQICTVADQYYKDPKTRLQYYEKFIEKFGEKRPYLSDFVKKRISELKEEIHFNPE